MLLGRDAILEANDLPTRDVEVPEWGGRVRVKTLTGEERANWEKAVVEVRGKRTEAKDFFRASLVANTAINDQGELIFTFRDVEALNRKSAKALERVYEAAAELCGLKEEDLEEMVKNSESVQSDDSISG